MSDLNHKPHPDALEQATAAIRDAATPNGPSPELVAATVAVMASRFSPPTPALSPAQRRRRRMFRYIGYGTATAATVAVLALGGVFGLARPAPAAELTEALDNVNKAKSYKHVLKMTFGGQTMFEMTTYKQGERMRFEAGKDIALVADDKGTVVQFDSTNKTATKLDVLAMKKDQLKPPAESAGLMKKIADLKGEGVERLGDETLDGKKTTVYAFKDVALGGATTDWKVWVDPKRKFPVRMEQLKKGDKDTETVMTSEYSGWNEEFDAKLFSLELPLGYRFVVPDGDKKPEPAESDAVVFINAIAQAEKAKSVKVTLSFEVGGKAAAVQTFVRRGDMIRGGDVADDESVTVVDLTTGEGVVLNQKAKTAEKMKIGGQERRMITGVIGDFEGIKATLGGGDEKAVKSLGEEKIGGRATKAFEVTAKMQPAGVYKVWIDPKTELPVRATFTDTVGKGLCTFDFADWNKELDAKLFTLDLPAGYKLVEAKKD